jgi:hypothetical protein
MIDGSGEEGSKPNTELVKRIEGTIINIDDYRRPGEFHPSKRRNQPAGSAKIIDFPKKQS